MTYETLRASFAAMQWQEADMSELAERWLAEQRCGSAPHEDDVGQQVVMMNFVAPPEVQWTFILAAVERARNEDELYTIAAGPFEHLLGHHGEAWIDRVEARASADPSFATMVTGA